MIKIIFFCFVFLTTFSIDWLAEARSSIELDERILCETGYYMSPVCGSDGETYPNIDVLKCAQKKQYGQRINLQFKREGSCWVFESYGVEPCTMFCVRKFRIDTISRKNRIQLYFCLNFLCRF